MCINVFQYTIETCESIIYKYWTSKLCKTQNVSMLLPFLAFSFFIHLYILFYFHYPNATKKLNINTLLKYEPITYFMVHMAINYKFKQFSLAMLYIYEMIRWCCCFLRENGTDGHTALNSLKSNMSSDWKERLCQRFNSLSTCAPITM